MEITEKIIRDVQKKRRVQLRAMEVLAAVNKERFGKEFEYHIEIDAEEIRKELEEIKGDVVEKVTIKMAKSLLESTEDEQIVLGCLKHVVDEPEEILQQAKKELEEVKRT